MKTGSLSIINLRSSFCSLKDWGVNAIYFWMNNNTDINVIHHSFEDIILMIKEIKEYR